jgi:predicted PurR-regulated permease PerM
MAPGPPLDRPTPGQKRSRVGGWPIVAALAVLAVLLYAVRYALLPFVFAVAIAFVTDPLIRTAQTRLGTARWPIAALLYILIALLLCAVGYLVVTTAADDLLRITADAPETIRKLITQAFGPAGVSLFGQRYTPDQLADGMFRTVQKLVGVDLAARLTRLGLSGVFGALLVLVLMPYFMISGPELADRAVWLIPPERRQSVQVLLPRIVPVLRRYLIGVFLVVVYTGVVAWVGFGLVFRLPHAILLAATVGVLELIPVAGPLASATIVGLVALRGGELWGAVFLMAFAIGLRLSIDNLVGPVVLGKAARVHPVVVIIAFVCGAMLFGIVGVLLAVPVVVCIRIALEHYYAEPIGGDEADDRAAPVRGEPC